MRSNKLGALLIAALVAAVGVSAVLRAQEQPSEATPANPSAALPGEATSPPPASTGGAADTPPPAFPDDDSATAPPPPAGAAKDATKDAGAAGAKDAADDDVDADKPPGKAPTGPSPSRFEPTEKVRADFDVSFPVDI
jgi:hypothetical protein